MWKNRLSNPKVQMTAKKFEAFNKVYTENMRRVHGKKATDIASVARAMFDLWRDTLSPPYESTEDLMSMYEDYLVEQKLILPSA